MGTVVLTSWPLSYVKDPVRALETGTTSEKTLSLENLLHSRKYIIILITILLPL